MKLLIFFTCLFLSINGNTQVDFNNYKPIQAKGLLPIDFLKETYVKFEEDLADNDNELNHREDKVFYKSINYAIDDILNSGYVIFGDEITSYLDKIVDNLLATDTALRSRIRVYTIKNNAVNAFSTDQGILFVTTGLVSQVTNEAQLAYVLAHEISHYTEKHVINTFSWRKENKSKSRDIEQLSIYSKDKEFAADRLALKWYNEAGYSKDEIVPTFDVLMYSYLPFDEIEVPLSYFATSGFYLPSDLYPKEPYEINADEDEDDSRSSHPNVRRRKDTAIVEMEKYNNWGTSVNNLGDKLFYHVRKIARFESVRIDLLDANFVDALYSIFLLEQAEPQSKYLERMKVQAWLGILIYKYKGSLFSLLDSKAKLEGAIGSVHHLFREMNSQEIETLSLRHIYDIVKKYPEDEEMNAIWELTLKKITHQNKLVVDEYSDLTFDEAKKNHERKIELAKQDSLQLLNTADGKIKTKYDRIKQIMHQNEEDNFDSTKYYLYGMCDIFSDTLFIRNYETLKFVFNEKEAEEEALFDLSYRQQNRANRKKEHDEIRLGLKDVILLEPTIISYRNQQFDRIKSEKLEETFTGILYESAELVEINTHLVNRATVREKGTEAYNERSTLMTLMDQMNLNQDDETFPVDYYLLNEIKENYRTSHVMLNIVENWYKPNLTFGSVVLGILVYPVGFAIIPLGILTGSHTEITSVIVDLDKANMATVSYKHINDSAKRNTIGAHMFSLFKQLKSTR